MPATAKKTVLVLGNYRQTLTVIRSLGRCGFKVIVGRTGRHSFTDYAFHTSEVWEHPEVRLNEPAFMAALAQLLAQRNDIKLIFPVGDTQISCLARNRDIIPPSVALTIPDPATVAACQDKSRLYDINTELRVAYADYRKVDTYADLLAAAAEVGFPCVVKPLDSFALLFNEKAVIVHSERELADAVPCWPDGHERLIVQKFATGYRHTCHFLADEGKILSYFDYKVLRTDRTNDTGYAVDSVSAIPTANVREYCAALTQNLRYCGVGSAQFLIDDDTGSVCFLEINPRLGAATAVPYYCGHDFPRMAAHYALYKNDSIADYEAATCSYPVGKRAAWLMGDLEALRRDIRTENGGPKVALTRLRQMLKTQAAADFHLTWSWKDPLPTCFIYAERALRPLRWRMSRKPTQG